MEQRRLRLGDIVDDYCPRERRVTNHAVVAMIEEDVKQTRCSTCEAEHPYKGGHAPRRRKKDAPGALYKEVLAGMPEADAAPVLAALPAALAASPDTDVAPALVAGPVAGTVEPPAAPAAAVALEPEPPAPVVEDGPVHRTLIRAQLPRVEGHKEVRQTPEFTIRQPGGRAAGNYHGGGGDQRGRPRGGGQGQGQPSNRPSGGGRFAGARAGNQGQGAPQGRRPSGGGFHAAQPQGRNGNGNGNGAGGGGGRKRSR